MYHGERCVWYLSESKCTTVGDVSGTCQRVNVPQWEMCLVLAK